MVSTLIVGRFTDFDITFTLCEEQLPYDQYNYFSKVLKLLIVQYLKANTVCKNSIFTVGQKIDKLY